MPSSEREPYLARHLREPIRVTQLTKMADLSPSHFGALFKQRTRHAPVDFLLGLRMNQASHLLDSTNLQVRKIAATAGYKDLLYFSRLLKSAHGVAPTLYRAAGSIVGPLLRGVKFSVSPRPMSSSSAKPGL